MRIAILSNNLPQGATGGAEIVAFSTGKALAARGHEILMITAACIRSESGRHVYDGLPVQTIGRDSIPIMRPFVSVTNPPVVRELNRVLSDFKPDVVHAHNIQAHLSYSSLRTAKQLGARVIMTCHDVTTVHHGRLSGLIRLVDRSIPHSFDYKLRGFKLRSNAIRNWRIRKTLARYADRIVAVSGALKDALEQNGIDNIEVVHNGIDATHWDISKDAVAVWKKAYGIGDAAVLFGGRLVEEKGCRQIIDAFAPVARRAPTAQLVVIGQKNRVAARMQAHTEALGIAHRVIFTGWLGGQELRAAFHAAALVATPSICFDSSPMMNLEAMACAKPVISTCLGGAREIVADTVTGYIVNPHDKEKFAERITELLSDHKKANQFGHAGHERVNNQFSLSANIERLENLFYAHTKPRRVAPPVWAHAGLEQPIS